MLAMLVFAGFSYAPAASAEPNPPATLSAAASVSGDFKTIILTFNSSFDPADGVDLKNAITIQRSGTNSFVSLDASDSVSYDSDEQDQLVLTLDKELVGDSNAIFIAANTLRIDGFADPYASPIEVDSIVGADIVPPQVEGAASYYGQLTLIFDENIIPVFPEDFDPEDEAQASAAMAEFQSKITIAQDGEHFSPLVDGLVNFSGGSNYLQISYRQDLEIVSGPKTKIKLAAGLLKDEAGNVTPEMTLSVSPPAIQSATLSADNHTVTVTFDREVYEVPNGNGPSLQILNDSGLRSRVYLRDDLGYTRGLGDGDDAKLEGNQLIITFKTALNGQANQIQINGGTLQDENGSFSGETLFSPYIQANPDGDQSDTTNPEFVNYVVSKDFKDITIQFNEDVALSDEDLQTFKDNVQWYNSATGRYEYELPSDATVTVAGSTINIHLESLIGNVHYWYFNLYSVSDSSGNYANDEFWTPWIDDFKPNEIDLEDGYFDLDGRYLSFYIDGYSNLYEDLTLDEGGSHLKDKISISLDNGKTFQPLSAGDKVVLNQNRISIFLQNRITAGTAQVKLGAGAITDSHHYQVNGDIEVTAAYNAPYFAGYLFSNADSELKFTDNADWRSHITSVKVYDDYTETQRELTASEYSIAAGKITIKKGVFLKDRRYEVGVEAEGYSTRYMYGYTVKSTDVFYITPPSITKTSGITAKVFIYNKAYGYNNDVYLLSSSKSGGNAGTQTVVFELFDGDTPVSIAAAELAVGTGTYSANFAVKDATTKNYTVKAFVVSSFDSDTLSLGLNLGTVKTQSEIDEAMMLSQYNNDNRP